MAAHFFLAMANLVERIAEIVEPVVVAAGYELVHLELVGNRRNMVLRLYVDRPGGVTVDDCAAVSERVGVVLDVEDPIAHSYTLEVCSPGIERGLYKKTDYQRFAGQEVKIETWQQIEGRRHFYGELVGIGPDDLVTVRERILQREIAIPYNTIRKAHLTFRWPK